MSLNRYVVPARSSTGFGALAPFITTGGNGPVITLVVGPPSLKMNVRSCAPGAGCVLSTTTMAPYSPEGICWNSLKCEWYMKVPALGGVKCTVRESPGAMAGRRVSAFPLQPGTPSA